MNLKEIQKQIFNIIRNQTIENCDIVINDKKIGVETRLNTYINSSYLKAKECIEDDFEASLKFIDNGNKAQIIKDYLTKYPPDTHFINEYGDNFLKYLHEINYQTNHEFLFDLIKLEWLRVESFYDFYNYKNQNAPHPKDQIIVNPSLKIIESNWPLDLIWSEKVAHSAKRANIFIWTTEDRVVDCLSWELPVTEVLLEIIKKKSLEESVENLLEKHESEFLTSTLETYLSQWINKGILQINQE